MDLQDNPILVKVQAELADLEKKVAEKKKFINSLYIYSDLTPPYPDSELDVSTAPAAGNGIKAVKLDEYFGQPAATAVRAVLKRYRDAGKSPVELDDIIKTLKDGGYKFTAGDDKGIKNSLTVMLSKNMEFCRVGSTGQMYGLREWYPGMVARKKSAARKIVIANGAKPETGTTPIGEEQEPEEESEAIEEDEQAEVA
jgi:hypothetical protein